MISVLHIIDTGGPGGAETVFLHCATRLNPGRFACAAVIGSDNWLAEQLRMRGIQPHIAPARGSFNLGYLRRIAAIAREVRADLICAHLYGTAVYTSALGLVRGIPVVSVFHGGADIESGDRFTSIKTTLIRRGTRKVVFVSRKLREELSPILKLPLSHTEIIPNGVDTTTFTPGHDDSIRRELQLPPNAILVGAVGNIRPAKAYDNFLRAARILADRSDRYHFVIAGQYGGGLADQLIRMRRELRLEKFVHFLGLRSDIATVLHNLDVFALSSKSEGFSIACVEAMACGIPVVATRCGGPEEILDECSGILVPSGSATEFADAIERVTNRHDIAEALSVAAMRRVAQNYSLSAMLTRYEMLFEGIAHCPTRTSNCFS